MEKRIFRIVVIGLLFLSTCKSVFAVANPTYPRTGNLWGWGYIAAKGLPYIAHIDLLIGGPGYPTAPEIETLRGLNPNIRVLNSVNAINNDELPEDYYLRDVKGNKIEYWPGNYLLNVTKKYVAEYQAQYAYQLMVGSGLSYDGIFWDNIQTAVAWRTEDCYGNPVQIDANEDHMADNAAELDAAWKAGIVLELNTFRALLPNAIVMCHAADINDPLMATALNGTGIIETAADVRNGKTPFLDLWNHYDSWMTKAKSPQVTLMEVSPPDQIAYGYGFDPMKDTPASTLEFARTLYPYMRFGLSLTLMKDGYFTYEFGDMQHGQDWWYDELDFDLGYPLGEAKLVDYGFDIGSNLIAPNGDFEATDLSPWWVGLGTGYAATAARDTSVFHQGLASARIDITASMGAEGQVTFNRGVHLTLGTAYDLSFWAKADAPRGMNVYTQRSSSPWDGCGSKRVLLSTSWQKYTVPFEATPAASDAKLMFRLGEATGKVWLDDVRLTLHPPDVYQREFTNGLVLLNGTKGLQVVTPGSGYRRLTGSQAPLFEKMIDDSESAFSIPFGTWSVNTYDSGEWKATGPFYHSWGSKSHLLTSSSGGEARWALPIPTTDEYTITAWWPAAPAASNWNQSVQYQIVSNGSVVASQTFSQKTSGDEWHTIGTVTISPTNNTYVKMTCSGSPCVADALYIKSKARYNNGSLAQSVTLQPLDGIILQRDSTVLTPTPASECSLKPKGDANCDGVVNILDFEIWRREFLGIDTTTKADFDGSGGVTILDFEIWRRGFLGQ